MTKISGIKTNKKEEEKQILSESIEIAITNSLEPTNVQKKLLNKVKRKNSVVISRSNENCVEKRKKQFIGGQKTLSVLQHKLSSNLARLAPLLNRSCPSDLLQIESFKTADQSDSTKQSKSTSHCTADIASQKYQGSSKKLQLFEKIKKSQNNGKIKSNNLVIPTQGIISKNISSPNLVVSTFYDQKKRFSAEFPNVVQFCQDDVSLTSQGRILPLSQRQKNWNSQPRPFLFTLSHNRVALASGRKSIGSPSSISAPNTPPTLLTISGRSRLEKSAPLLKAAGWNCLRGLTTSDLASVAFDTEENNGGVSETTEHIKPQADDGVKLYDSNTLNLISSIKKAMNAKSNSQITATNQKNGQPQPQLQYHTGRTRPRIGNTFSSSFILPYGLGNRVQSSPVTTPAVPNSSSFHGGPLESLQLMSENHQRAARQQCNSGQQQQKQQRKYLERQKMKMLKPLGVNKNQGNITKLYDISTSEFSAAILPDPGTTTYRLTHDVSFDEGSRYRTTDFPHNVKGKDDSRVHHSNYNGIINQFASTRTNDAHAPNSQARHEGRIIVSRDHNSNNNNISFKESVPLSLIRMDERFAVELPPATSPSSPAMSSSAIAATTSTSSFIPPPSASRQNPPNATNASAGSNITFRLHKEKHNWNYRLGELSINGGGLYTPSSGNSNARPDLDSMSLNMTSTNSATQRNSLTRERISFAPKSRMSSRYASKTENATAAASYSDPCISAPPSFQQRLTDLSILESETIKYERNRKMRRKKNQDKDS